MSARPSRPTRSPPACSRGTTVCASTASACTSSSRRSPRQGLRGTSIRPARPATPPPRRKSAAVSIIEDENPPSLRHPASATRKPRKTSHHKTSDLKSDRLLRSHFERFSDDFTPPGSSGAIEQSRTRRPLFGGLRTSVASIGSGSFPPPFPVRQGRALEIGDEHPVGRGHFGTAKHRHPDGGRRGHARNSPRHRSSFAVPGEGTPTLLRRATVHQTVRRCARQGDGAKPPHIPT